MNIKEEVQKLKGELNTNRKNIEAIEWESKKISIKIENLYACCQHDFTKWEGNQYNRIRTCKICGYEEYRG